MGGLLLSTDYLLIQIVAFVVGKPAHGIGQGMMQCSARLRPSGSAESRISRRLRSGRARLAASGAKILSVRVKGRTSEEAKAATAVEPEVVAAVKAPATKDAEPDVAATPPQAGSRRRRVRRRPYLACCGSASRKRPKKEEELQLDEPPQNAADYELFWDRISLLASESFNFDEQEKEVRRRAKILEQTFKDFGFNIRTGRNPDRPGDRTI